MVTLTDPLPLRRSASLLGLDFITAPPSTVIAVGTVAARVQAWHDLINNHPRASEKHGPSPPSERNIKSRNGSDRGVRSGFGHRSDDSFGKPAGRSNRNDPEGTKRDGLPPLGLRHRKTLEAIGSQSSDVEEHRLAGVVRETTSMDLMADRRAQGRSLSTFDSFNPWGTFTRTSEKGSNESQVRRAANRHSTLVVKAADYDQRMSNHSSPKSVIDELGEMIDEALDHHERNAIIDRATAEHIEESLDHYRLATSLYQARVQEIRRQREERSQRDLRTEEYLQESRDKRPAAGTARKSSGRLYQQTPLIAKMAAERLATSEPTSPLEDVAIESASTTPAHSPPQDRGPSRTLIRRPQKKRRASTIFGRPPVINDYPMDELQRRRSRSLTNPSMIPENSQESESVDPAAEPTSPNKPSLPILIRRSSSRDKRHPRRQSVAFRSSVFQDEPLEEPTELQGARTSGHAAHQSAQPEKSVNPVLRSPGKRPSADDHGTRRETRSPHRGGSPLLCHSTSSARGLISRQQSVEPQQYPLASQQPSPTDSVVSPEQNDSTTDMQTKTVTESETNNTLTPTQSPKASESSADSRNVLTPKAWPFRWPFGFIDKSKSKSQRREWFMPETPESVRLHWGTTHTGSGGRGAEVGIHALSSPRSYEALDFKHESSPRRAKKSQSDPQLSQTAATASGREESDETEKITEHESPCSAKSTSLTPAYGYSRSALVSREASRLLSHDIIATLSEGLQKARTDTEEQSLHDTGSTSPTPGYGRSGTMSASKRVSHQPSQSAITTLKEGVEEAETGAGEQPSPPARCASLGPEYVRSHSASPSKKSSRQPSRQPSRRPPQGVTTNLREGVEAAEMSTREQRPRRIESATHSPKYGRSRSTTLSRKSAPRTQRSQPGTPRTRETYDSNKASIGNVTSMRQSRIKSGRSSEETEKPAKITATSKIDVSEEVFEPESINPVEFAMAEQLGAAAHHHALSRHSRRRERTESTVDASRTIRARTQRGRTIMIKVEIRTADDESEMDRIIERAKREDTIVVKAHLGPNRELSIESEKEE